MKHHCFFPGNTIFYHISEWWAKHRTANVLWVQFSDLITKPKLIAHKIAEFTQDSKLKSIDLEKISDFIDFSYQKRRKRRFDMHDLQFAAACVSDFCMNNENYRFSRLVNGIHSIRNEDNRSNIDYRLPISIEFDMRKQWKDIVWRSTGFRTFVEMEKRTTMKK